MAHNAKPEAPHGPEHGHDAHAEDHAKVPEHGHEQEKVAEELKEAQKKAHGEVQKHVPDDHVEGEHHVKEEELKPYKGPAFKPFPSSPSLETVGKAGLLGLTVAMPPLGLTVGAGAWGYKKLSKYPPFSWVNSGIKKTLDVAKSGAGSVLNILSYPLKIGKWGVENTLALAGKIVMPPINGLRWLLHQAYVDTRDVMISLAGARPKTNLVSATAGAGVRGIKTVSSWCWHHPKTSLIGGAVIAGYLMSYGPAGIPKLIGLITDAFTASLKWIISKAPVSAPIPVP